MYRLSTNPSRATRRLVGRASAAPRAHRQKSSQSLMNMLMPRRSEERRVGKECRSLCDWSSDVCSSDLESIPGYEEIGWAGIGGSASTPSEIIAILNEHVNAAQIGRASCRERV